MQDEIIFYIKFLEEPKNTLGLRVLFSSAGECLGR